MKLFFNALIKIITGFLLISLLLFLPAGELYPRGILFLVLLFLPMTVLGAILFIKAPELLKRRLDTKEKERTQKGVVSISALLFIALFVVAGLDRRFSWSLVPTWAVVLSSAIFFLSYLLYAEVMRENAYLSRTIKVEKGQGLVDGGLYGIVRHPMYSITLFLFFSIPVILGSWWALLAFSPYLPLIVTRILNEEKVLEKELEGYSEYKRRVKFRLIPFIW